MGGSGEQQMVCSVDDVAAAVLSRVGPTDAMKLQKLLYYAQAWTLATTDQPLFAEPIEAWDKGPVVRPVFANHKGKRRINDWPRGDAARVTGEAGALVALVCSVYGALSGDELSEMTHSERPWLEARGDLPAGALSSTAIDTATMKAFYRQRTLGGWHPADLAASDLAGLYSDALDDELPLTSLDEDLAAMGIVYVPATGEWDAPAAAPMREQPHRAAVHD